MIYLKNPALLTFCLLPFFLKADGPYLDESKADIDGPYVFYRGGKIIVKSVALRDTTPILETATYDQKSDVRLSCYVAETGDRFSFALQDELAVEPEVYPQASRLLVLSDIEGNFKAFKTMLLSAKVIDEEFNWTFGDGQLLLLGDFFDRGLSVTECLWLCYKLETEAEAAGGKVHFLLGNHEVLNLAGNTTYVRKKYLENVKILKENFSRWYDNQTELGRWLRSKNAVEKIGDYVFCHGGISPNLAESGIRFHEINRIARNFLGKPFETITNHNAVQVFDIKTGIFWYRNAAKNALSEKQVSDILEYAGAKRMVVGHTLQNDITSLYNGSVICIDLYHDENIRRGFMKTLWVEDGFCYGLDSRGEKSSLFQVDFLVKEK
jgi:Calcineurin-like phosphoesterase